MQEISLFINPLNAELNPICHLLALLGGAIIVVVSRLRVKQDLQITYVDRIQTFSVKSVLSYYNHCSLRVKGTLNEIKNTINLSQKIRPV
jgi:hypothetical protein